MPDRDRRRQRRSEGPDHEQDRANSSSGKAGEQPQRPPPEGFTCDQRHSCVDD
jgi:hypothetical protein